MNYTFNITKVEKSAIHEFDFDNIPFGKVFADHMFMADYIDGQWTNLTIQPMAPISTHPANMAWHYGQAIFEGMKASRDAEGNAFIFRPEMHAQRFNKSAFRMNMPQMPEDLFMQAVHTLVSMEKEWIPKQEGSAMYIRPFMYATDHSIGIKVSNTYRFIILVLPVGPYYNHPVKLLAQDKYIRAVVGGVGEAKAAGNYAAAMYPTTLAKEAGFDQVVWLDGVEKKYIQEVGTMNIFFVINNEILTPALDGAILDGITRNSLITLFKDQGYKVTERRITIDEVMEAGKNGNLTEIFGSGTAAVVAPVSTLQHNEEIVELDTNNRPISLWAYETINGMRNRTIEDKFGWLSPAK
ncbi:MAG: branched-chain amino acid aminotransferase [Bacteroidetes bacterium OLB9]|nr:MAG: branched-chain amino acid aminotransferase [Bacteroidetes bacterium OLB9]MCZ2338075.1 branched-chain amino acid aminotransferase [Chitinophagales bacterium]